MVSGFGISCFAAAIAVVVLTSGKFLSAFSEALLIKFIDVRQCLFYFPV